MRFEPAHQSLINRRLDDRVSCPARKSLKQALARKPRIYSPASGKGGHESALAHLEARDSVEQARHATLKVRCIKVKQALRNTKKTAQNTKHRKS
jgi:hypothetical protein